jgi:hypothetical protein
LSLRRFSYILAHPENILLGSIALCLGTVLVSTEGGEAGRGRKGREGGGEGGKGGKE